MFSRSNLNNLKTTLLGIALLAASVAYVFYVDKPEIWIFGLMGCMGICLIFLPDTLFSSLKNLLTKNSNKQF